MRIDRVTMLTGELFISRHRYAELEDEPNPGLLDALPVGSCDLAALPKPLARRLLEALRLEIHFNKTANTVIYRVTLLVRPSQRCSRSPAV